MTRRVRSVWESLALESVEGPTVTVSLSRELAQELAGVLMGALEMDGGEAHAEPDEDDLGGAPDGDADDSDPLASLMGDPEDGDGGLDLDDPTASDGDDDDDDEPEESVVRGRSGIRPGTALGERRRSR